MRTEHGHSRMLRWRSKTRKGTIIRIHPPRTDLKQWWSRAVKHYTLLGAISVPVSFVLGIVCLCAFAVIFYLAAAYIPLPLPAGNAAPEKSTLIVSVLTSTLIVSVLAAAFAVILVSFFYRVQWVKASPLLGLTDSASGRAWRSASSPSSSPSILSSKATSACSTTMSKSSSASLFAATTTGFLLPDRRWLHALAPWTNPHDKRPANLDSALPFRDGSFDALELWRQYIWRGWWWHRLVRVVTLTLLFLLGSWFAFVAFDGGFSSSTARSGIARWCDRGSMGLLFIATTFVTLFVVDALCLNASFIRLCDSGFARWPEDVLKRSGLVGPLKKERSLRSRSPKNRSPRNGSPRNSTSNSPPRAPPPSANSSCIPSSSSPCSSFPVPPTSMTGAGPSASSSSWLPSLVSPLLAAVNLRRAAEKARKGALGRLQATRDGAATQDGTEKRVRILDTVIKRIADLDEGAFAPFSQQPIIRALLFPAGGIGMWEMARQLLGNL